VIFGDQQNSIRKRLGVLESPHGDTWARQWLLRFPSFVGSRAKVRGFLNPPRAELLFEATLYFRGQRFDFADIRPFVEISERWQRRSLPGEG
jgi:hypothetical protein